ncbi:hypothetical protein ACFWCA_19070 [Streptomyces phaeochromogenes]|uniref:deazapurine DNA modification protein DpdA family protein n=1 Tax=Streptomyces phaeochromogenes TaxID=1923 RepID=UPI00368509F2
MPSAALFDIPALAGNVKPKPKRPAPVHVDRRWFADVDRVTYLGTHQPVWLEREEFGRDCIPLCVAQHRLSGRATLPRAVTPWMLDSGGYKHLEKHGTWTLSPYMYAADARRYYDDIGMMDVCAIQDWMCEDEILAATGLTVADHQLKTVASFLNLMTLDAELPWMPIIQGRTLDDYLRCIDLYDQVGIDLMLEPVVGIGSVCRLQRTDEAARIIETIWSMGIRLHGFGFKATGLRRVAHLLYSSDSMAWSMNAVNREPMPGCVGQHVHCGNCPKYARAWRNQLLNSLPDDPQLLLAA